jgi:crotonobetainyl-CoA:carnitine CoA-transferase CaiB-like acyl-CoA transferase
VALTVETDAQWHALCGAMLRPDLAADFATAHARIAHRETIDAVVGEWLRAQDAFAAMQTLQALGIAAGPVLNSRDLLLNEHLAHRKFYERVLHPQPIGLRPMMGRPYRWELRRPHVHKRAPVYAEDNRSILRELPGYTEERIAELVASRVVCDTPATRSAPEAMGIAQLLALRAVCEVDADYREKLGVA